MTVFQSKQANSWMTVAPGVEFCNLRNHASGGLSVLVRMAAGARAQAHTHPGGEETYLVSGRLVVGEGSGASRVEHTLEPGDYLWTPPGVAHDGFADQETTFFVVLPDGLQLEDKPLA